MRESLACEAVKTELNLDIQCVSQTYCIAVIVLSIKFHQQFDVFSTYFILKSVPDVAQCGSNATHLGIAHTCNKKTRKVVNILREFNIFLSYSSSEL